MFLHYQVFFDILKESGTTGDELMKKLEVHGVHAMQEGPCKYVSSITFSTLLCSIFTSDENHLDMSPFARF